MSWRGRRRRDASAVYFLHFFVWGKKPHPVWEQGVRCCAVHREPLSRRKALLLGFFSKFFLRAVFALCGPLQKRDRYSLKRETLSLSPPRLSQLLRAALPADARRARTGARVAIGTGREAPALCARVSKETRVSRTPLSNSAVRTHVSLEMYLTVRRSCVVSDIYIYILLLLLCRGPKGAAVSARAQAQ